VTPGVPRALGTNSEGGDARSAGRSKEGQNRLTNVDNSTNRQSKRRNEEVRQGATKQRGRTRYERKKGDRRPYKTSENKGKRTGKTQKKPGTGTERMA